MAERSFVILYTNQKTKKAKTWHDGTLRFSGNGTRGILYDDKNCRIDTIHVRSEDVVLGEQLESDRHYILIEEESKAGATNQNAAPKDQPTVGPIRTGGYKPRIRTGLKKGRGGFVPPRLIAAKDQEPPKQQIANVNRGDMEGRSPVRNSCHFASFQRRYNILNQVSPKRTLSELNNSVSSGKDPLFVNSRLQNSPDRLNYGEKSSPLIGLVNKRSMTTSPWSTIGSSQSPVSSKFESQQDTDIQELESKSFTHCMKGQVVQSKGGLQHTMEDQSLTSHHKRSATQILALLSKTPSNPLITEDNSGTNLQITKPSPRMRHSNTGELKCTYEKMSPVIQSEESKKEGQLIQRNKQQSEASPSTNINNFGVDCDGSYLSSYSSQRLNHSSGSFIADSKNQPDDSHYDLISTPSMVTPIKSDRAELCESPDYQSEGRIEIALQHIIRTEPEQITMSEPQQLVQSEPKYTVVSEPQHVVIGKSQDRVHNEPQHNVTTEPQLSAMSDHPDNLSSIIVDEKDSATSVPGVNYQSELTNGELALEDVSRSKEDSDKKCHEVRMEREGEDEDEDEMDCQGGASFAISFSPLSVIPSDSESDYEEPPSKGDNIQQQEEQGYTNNQRSGKYAETSDSPSVNNAPEIATKTIVDRESLNKTEVNQKNKLQLQEESQDVVEISEENTVTCQSDTKDSNNLEEKESTICKTDGEVIHCLDSGQTQCTILTGCGEKHIKEDGKDTKQKVMYQRRESNQTNSEGLSQKSLGCLELSPDSPGYFTKCSPTDSNGISQNVQLMMNSSDIHIESVRLPVFETSWSEEDSMFDTSPLRLNRPQSQECQAGSVQSHLNSLKYPQKCDVKCQSVDKIQTRDKAHTVQYRSSEHVEDKNVFKNSHFHHSDQQWISEEMDVVDESCSDISVSSSALGGTGINCVTKSESTCLLGDLPHPSELIKSPQETEQKDLSKKISERMGSYKMRGSVTGMAAKRHRVRTSQQAGFNSNTQPNIVFSQVRRGQQSETTAEEAVHRDWIDRLKTEHENRENLSQVDCFLNTTNISDVKRKYPNHDNLENICISNKESTTRLGHHIGMMSYNSPDTLLETEEQILNNFTNNNSFVTSESVTVFNSQDEEICKDDVYGRPRKMFSPDAGSLRNHPKLALRSQPFDDQCQDSQTYSHRNAEYGSVNASGQNLYTDAADFSTEHVVGSSVDGAESILSKWGKFMPVDDEEDLDHFNCSYDFDTSLVKINSESQRHDSNVAANRMSAASNQASQVSSLRSTAFNTAYQRENAKAFDHRSDTMGIRKNQKFCFKGRQPFSDDDSIDHRVLENNLSTSQKALTQRNEENCTTSSHSMDSSSLDVTQKSYSSNHQMLTNSTNQCVGISPNLDLICLGSSPSLYDSPDQKSYRFNSPASQPIKSGSVELTKSANQKVPVGARSQTSSEVSSPTGQRVPEAQTDSSADPVIHISHERRFNSPIINPASTPNILIGTKRSLWDDLQFASLSEVESNPTPVRRIVIPTIFSSPLQYKQVLMSALREHLNIILFDLSKQYHQVLSKTDTTYLTFPVKNTQSRQSRDSGPPLPPCHCGVSSKLIQVRKEGPNKGRYFYSCTNPASQRCKFFQWADSCGNVGLHHMGGAKVRLTDATSVTSYFRQHHIMFYCQCQFLQKSMESILAHFKNPWAKQKYQRENKMQRKYFIRLSRKDSSTLFSKDDLWIVSRDLNFDSTCTILAKSMYYGPTSGNEVEIEPVSKFSPSNWNNEAPCHAVLAGNVTSELSYLDNIQDNVQQSCLPILSQLLSVDSGDASKTHKRFQPPRLNQGKSVSNIHVPEYAMNELVTEFMTTYSLNEDQGSALRRLAAMFCEDSHNEVPSLLLIHGVFGAGKSFLLSVMVRFLVRVFEVNGSYTPGLPYPWKILISSTTNVAVDRVLMGLLDIGFEDFVRVGSMKKIAKPVLPYSVHATGTESQELKDLQEMMRSGDLSPSEKHNVRQSIEKHKLGENKKKLGSVAVVGVTCASCVAPSLKDLKFPVVILDECSQMTEPASLFPMSKFACEKLVLVGDPKQLDPTIQGSEASHSEGLEQTMFDRLVKMGHIPTLLRVQYRCHPVISNLANTLFYQGQLLDGVKATDRTPVMDILPTLCFYDVSNGQESSDPSGSFSNEKEADFVAFMIEALVNGGVDSTSIGVITLYKSQMYSIIAKLGTSRNCSQNETKSILVSTVDAFQGGERNIIILSCVRTNNTGFIDNHKRTNVALTRARHHLFIVGHLNNLERNQLWGKVISMCKACKDGMQKAEEACHALSSLLDRSSQESSSSLSTRQLQRGNRKRKQEEEDSPPMSLTGQTEESLDSESPVILSSSEVAEELSRKKSKRRRELPQIDPTLLDSDKENEENEEELPVFDL